MHLVSLFPNSKCNEEPQLGSRSQNIPARVVVVVIVVVVVVVVAPPPSSLSAPTDNNNSFGVLMTSEQISATNNSDDVNLLSSCATTVVGLTGRTGTANKSRPEPPEARRGPLAPKWMAKSRFNCGFNSIQLNHLVEMSAHKTQSSPLWAANIVCVPVVVAVAGAKLKSKLLWPS